MFEILGNKCVKCGFTDKRALQFDHINGDGKLDRKRHKATQFYRYCILDKKNTKKRLQILCANCNYIKRIEKWEFKKPKYENLIEREMAIEI